MAAEKTLLALFNRLKKEGEKVSIYIVGDSNHLAASGTVVAVGTDVVCIHTKGESMSYFSHFPIQNIGRIVVE